MTQFLIYNFDFGFDFDFDFDFVFYFDFVFGFDFNFDFGLTSLPIFVQANTGTHLSLHSSADAVVLTHLTLYAGSVMRHYKGLRSNVFS